VGTELTSGGSEACAVQRGTCGRAEKIYQLSLFRASSRRMRGWFLEKVCMYLREGCTIYQLSGDIREIYLLVVIFTLSVLV